MRCRHNVKEVTSLEAAANVGHSADESDSVGHVAGKKALLPDGTVCPRQHSRRRASACGASLRHACTFNQAVGSHCCLRFCSTVSISIVDEILRLKGPSLCGQDTVGKDLSRVCLPVYFNEPLSMLQKMPEDAEYTELVDKVCCLWHRWALIRSFSHL